MALCVNNNVIVDEFRFKVNQLLQFIDLYAMEYNTNAAYLEKVKDIKVRFLNHNDTLEDLCSIEKKLISIAPEACLRKYYIQLTSRYKEVLPKEAGQYISKENFNDKKMLNDDDLLTLREETLYISGLLHKYYHFLENKERVISQYKLLFIILLLIMFAVSGIAFLLSIVSSVAPASSKVTYTTDAILLVIAMICAGYFGAVISIVKRIQGIADKSMDGVDREDLLLKLVNGKWGIFLSILLGTLSPFILLLLLFILQDAPLQIGGFNLLPQFCGSVNDCQKATEGARNTAMSILYMVTFVSKKDVAEFIILSIACGFSERFVPDVLDRVSKELEEKVRSKPGTK